MLPAHDAKTISFSKAQHRLSKLANRVRYAIPGVADVVNPSTLGYVESVDGPAVRRSQVTMIQRLQ